MSAIQNYLDELLNKETQSDSQRTFRFSVSVTEEDKNRLEYVASELGVSRAEFASELMLCALFDAEMRLGLRPKDDADAADRANWSERRTNYVKDFLPLIHFASLHASGEITQEEFWKHVKFGENLTLVLKEEE